MGEGSGMDTTLTVPTKNGIDEKSREAVASLLNQHLASAIDLQLQAKQMHWNVKGSNFIGLHKLFDDVAEMMEGFVDDLAERAVQLWGSAEGGLGAVAETSQLAKTPSGPITGEQAVDFLSDSLAKFGTLVREAIGEAEKHGDMDTADLYTEVSRGVDKQLWFVEAHNH